MCKTLKTVPGTEQSSIKQQESRRFLSALIRVWFKKVNLAEWYKREYTQGGQVMPSFTKPIQGLNEMVAVEMERTNILQNRKRQDLTNDQMRQPERRRRKMIL